MKEMIFRKPGTAKSGPKSKEPMKPTKAVIDAFKRNPDLKAVHVVLSEVFDDLKRAERYKNSIRALKVNSILRTECAVQLGETKDDSTEQ